MFVEDFLGEPGSFFFVDFGSRTFLFDFSDASAAVSASSSPRPLLPKFFEQKARMFDLINKIKVILLNALSFHEKWFCEHL